MSVIKAKLSDFTKQREIAAGGEGKIYEHPSDKNKVVKIYHKARNSQFVAHLELLSKELGSLMFVRPQDIFVDSTGKCLGFEMQYVNFNDYWLFNNLFNKGFCTSNNIDDAFKQKVLNQMAACIQMLHRSKITVGDLNQYNLFVSKQGDILFVDVDSYATQNQPHSGVLLDDIRDWTTTDINDKTDIWAYDILAFWATTYCHPYKWVASGNKESLEMRVKGHKSILSKISGIKIPALYIPPVGDVLNQFEDIFNRGRRYMVDFKGAYVPVSTVVKQQIVTSNNLSIRPLYDNITDIHVSDESFAIKTGISWVLMEASVLKVTRQLAIIDCDEMFPSGTLYAYRKGDMLYSQSGRQYYFRNPIFYYNNGYLTVIEYDADMQWNYDISKQLGGGLDNTNTPVFAKSIIKRDGLLQNFGSQIFLNIPMYNRYSMIRVQKGTKNAYYTKGFIVSEYKDQRSVGYTITDTNKLTTLDLDYFPYIAVALGGTILVPEDGYIDVYNNLQFLTRFDCPPCTRTSKLYYTKAGILMLEGKNLYLLNTK